MLLISWSFTGNYVFGLAFVLVFINPVLEEVYWRGYMMDRFLRTSGPLSAIAVTSFFYAFYHLLSIWYIFSWPYNLLIVLPVFVAGIVWGLFKYKLRSVSAPIISHSFADGGILLVYFTYVAV
nr:CPBP family intramembrane glutamic endopeptidase [Metabacillus lacus]